MSTRTVRILSTLHPERLRPSDLVDISNMFTPMIHLPPAGKVIIPYFKRIHVFPANTRGFFYYYTLPKAPPVVGELRFRYANSLDEFHSGNDLMSPDGLAPWSIGLRALANCSLLRVVQEKLLYDGLVSQAILDKWNTKNIPAPFHETTIGLDQPTLYYLRQPFVVNLGCPRISFYSATQERITVCEITKLMFDSRQSWRGTPYGGRAIIQLEPYACPFRPGQDKVAIRVLKLVEPVRDLLKGYDGHIHRPTEGKLLERSSTRKALTILTKALDTSCLRGLLALPINFEDLP